MVHFGPTFDKHIKPWVLPDFMNRLKEGSIAVRWNARVSPYRKKVPQSSMVPTEKSGYRQPSFTS
jgi:hypothetical protein